MRPRLALLIVLFSVGASWAQAAAITNLSGAQQAVSLVEWGGHTTITIPDGRTLRIPGRAAFRYQNREMRIDENEEYAIWPDGTFGPQRYFKRRSFSRF